jgi:hypothetical protein
MAHNRRGELVVGYSRPTDGDPSGSIATGVSRRNRGGWILRSVYGRWIDFEKSEWAVTLALKPNTEDQQLGALRAV